MGSLKNVKETYTASAWADREKYYLDELDKINVPKDISTADIKMLESMIDSLYSESNMDLAFTNRKFLAFERYRKFLEKELFLIIKGQGISGLKSVDEVNGAVAVGIKVVLAADVLNNKPIDVNAVTNAILSTLSNTPITPNTSMNILQAIRINEERTLFLEHVLDSLRNKHSSLITDEGALKLENDIARTGNNNG